MRLTFGIAFAFLAGAGCAKRQAAFVEGPIRIVEPVTIEESFVLDDGGSQMLGLRDAGNTHYCIFINHRLGDDKNWGKVSVRVMFHGRDESFCPTNQAGIRAILAGAQRVEVRTKAQRRP